MPIRVTTNFHGDLTFTNREVMRQIGLLAREKIRRRTARGISAEGAAFRPYSAAYAAAKRDALGGSGTVNLAASGEMLNALQIVEVTENSVTLGFR